MERLKSRPEAAAALQQCFSSPKAVLGCVEPRLRLAINLKTAKALSLTIPQSLLLRADEVIQ